MFKKLFSRLQMWIYYDVFEHVLEGNIHQPPLLLIAQIYLMVPKLANSELLLCFIQDSSISVLCCKSTWTFTQSSSKVFFSNTCAKFFDAVTIIGIQILFEIAIITFANNRLHVTNSYDLHMNINSGVLFLHLFDDFCILTALILSVWIKLALIN